MKSLRKLVPLFCFTISLALAAELPTGAPESAGFSRERLDRIDAVMRAHISAGELAGASGLIARHGKVVFRQTWGDYKPDTIVRMYSMTKAQTAVAAMMLYEEGKFSLNDPLSKYLPEFAHMRVAKDSTDAAGKRIYYTEPVDRPIRVVDLFRHTTGLDYTGPKDENDEPAYKKIEMLGGAPHVSFDLAEAVKRLASVPLNDEPGSRFRYGYSVDVLGRLVEVLSGMPLDQFFEQRIYKPLAMKDSGFFVPEAKWSRLATIFRPKKGGGIEPTQGGPQVTYKEKPALMLGGAGSVGTLDDYARFATMLLQDGQIDGTRLLGRKTVEMMHSDFLGDRPRTGVLPEGYGFGLTFAINRGPGQTATVGSQGEYYWGGAAGTAFWIDPKEQMIGVFLIQVLPPNIQAGDQFKRMAYEALID